MFINDQNLEGDERKGNTLSSFETMYLASFIFSTGKKSSTSCFGAIDVAVTDYLYLIDCYVNFI